MSGRRAAVLIGLALIALSPLAACGDPPPTAPAPSSVVAGTWIGTATDRVSGVAQLRVELSGSGELGTGPFSLTLVDASAVEGVALALTRDNPSIDLTLNIRSSTRDCPGVPGIFYSARLALTGNRMTGTYEPSIGCTLLGGGSLELTRR